MHTYFFYDIESTGLNKAFDQVIQFAAIRTDKDFNTIDEHELIVKLNTDVIPTAQAMITHQVPLSDINNGINEVDAMRQIHAWMNTPGTISLGYNTLGFDDEFLRFSFYRNLLPPYTHQYANQCSRMDLYPMAIFYYLYKPEVISWPTINNKTSLKLEHINNINQLATGQAHNAMVDVKATVELAKKFKQDIKTWEYLEQFFDKKTDQQRINKLKTYTGFRIKTLEASNNEQHLDFAQQVRDDIIQQPVSTQQIQNNNIQNSKSTQLHQNSNTQETEITEGLLVLGKLGYKNNFQAPALSLGNHYEYKNQSLWLRLDTEDLKKLKFETHSSSTTSTQNHLTHDHENTSSQNKMSTAEETEENIRQYTWVISKKMGEPGFILPLQERFMQHISAERLELINKNKKFLTDNPDILNAITQYHRQRLHKTNPDTDIDAGLYTNDFISASEYRQCKHLLDAEPSQKAKIVDTLDNPLIQSLAVRMLGRHYPEHMTDTQKNNYQDYIDKLDSEIAPEDFKGDAKNTRQKELANIAEVRETLELTANQLKCLNELEKLLQPEGM